MKQNKIFRFLSIGLVILISLEIIYEMTHDNSYREKIGDEIYFYYVRRDILGTDIEIPPYVESYYTTDKYIFVRQYPRLPREAVYKDVYYPNGYTCTYYWLFDKTDKVTTGPLEYSDFILELRNIGIDRQTLKKWMQENLQYYSSSKYDIRLKRIRSERESTRLSWNISIFRTGPEGRQ